MRTNSRCLRQLFGWIAAFLLLNGGIGGSPAEAASPFTDRPDVVNQLIERSDRVIVGEVVSTWLETGAMGFQTVAMIVVQETLAGYRSPVAQIRVAGGRIDGIRQHTPGSIELQVGDEMLLFLSGDRITGLAEGAFYLSGSRASRNHVALWELGVGSVERADWSLRSLRSAVESQRRFVVRRDDAS